MTELNKEKTYEHDDDSPVDRAALLQDLESQDPLSGSLYNDRNVLTSQSTLATLARPLDQSTAFLDGLRGVAALCVFNQHFIGGGAHEQGFGQKGEYYFISLPFVRPFYNGGSAAVSIFFVLSGYVLSQTPVKLFVKGQRQSCKKSLISAVVRRPFRLYLPCFAVALLIALLMHVPWGFYPDLPWSAAQDSVITEIFHCISTCIKFFQPFQSHSSDMAWFQYDLVVWTIPIELKGSMLVYLLTAVCCFGFSSPMMSTGLLLSTVMISLQLGWWSGACFIGGLALTLIDLYGLDVSLVYRHVSPSTRNVMLHVIFVVGYYLLSQPAVAGHPEWSRDTPGWNTLTLWIPLVYDKGQYYRFWQSYGALLFVYCTLRIRWLQVVFNTKPLRYLGKVSFMLYLLHLPLLYSVGDRLIRVFGQIGLGAEPKWWDNLLYVPDIGPKGLSTRWAVDWTVVLTIGLVLSHLGTQFMDQPSVTIGKQISGRLGLDPPPRSRRTPAVDSIPL